MGRVSLSVFSWLLGGGSGIHTQIFGLQVQCSFGHPTLLSLREALLTHHMLTGTFCASFLKKRGKSPKAIPKAKIPYALTPPKALLHRPHIRSPGSYPSG